VLLQHLCVRVCVRVCLHVAQEKKRKQIKIFHMDTALQGYRGDGNGGVCVCIERETDLWQAHVRSGDWITHKEGLVAVANPRSGLVNTHLRLRYHAKAVYALMGLVLSLIPN
jgi:hypothetical protein